MSVKLRQITDSVHETIYLSELESEFISTPYFFRLHDVYQSSTVYMTYPSNRTKRYEHSIGTMELASDLLFSSVANADKKTRNQLIKNLRDQFWNIYDRGFLNGNKVRAKYYTLCENTINNAIHNEYQNKKTEFNESFEKDVIQAFDSGILNDKTFERYQISSLFSETDKDCTISLYNVFLFRCLFQAIRIVALFHDAGHPPYSHIIEIVIKELYDEIQKDLNDTTDVDQTIIDKKTEFINCVKPFIVKDPESAYKASMLLTQTSLMSEFHERVGLALLQSAINDVIPLSVKRVAEMKGKKEIEKRVAILYYITVAEFTMCILTEENEFFKSFHKIVDGFIDADRLDYVVRDSANSGVHWNRIPYKRVLESAKLFYDENSKNGVFLLAFAKKNQRDLVDFLITRYKVFSWINYHHRCIRTSVALQSCVKTIATNYLNSNDRDNKSLCPDIKTLWYSLDGSQGNIETRIIQWNDSWLITTLQKTYIDLYKSHNDSTEYKTLFTDLEEIILNKKKLYTIIKRGSDSVELVKAIFEEAGITEELLNKIAKKEQAIVMDPNKTYDPKKIMTNEKYNAKDSIQQIDRLRHILKTGNLELFYTTMPLSSGSVDEIITNVLTKLENEGKILGFKTLDNTGRTKFGLPAVNTDTKDAFENIYLFDNDSKPYPMDVSISLRPQLNIMSYDSPYMFIYIIPPENKDNNKLSQDVINDIAKAIGIKLRERFVQAFPNSTQEN